MASFLKNLAASDEKKSLPGWLDILFDPNRSSEVRSFLVRTGFPEQGIADPRRFEEWRRGALPRIEEDLVYYFMALLRR